MEYCARAVSEYLAYLQTTFEVLPSSDGCRLVTPFTYQDGRCIELVVSKEASGRLAIRDDCTTVDYLFLNGLTTDGEEFLEDALAIAIGHRVEFVDSELRVVIPEAEIGDGLHRLLSAAVALGDLIHKRRQRPISLFEEEVEAFFASHNIPVERRYRIQGKTAVHRVNFYINGRHRWLAEALSVRTAPSARTQGRLLAFQWLDIRNLVGDHYTYTVILDDKEGQMEKFWSRPHLARPVFDYSTYVFLWSEIEKLPEALAIS